METNPDQIVFDQLGPMVFNATIVFTWVTMAVILVGAWLGTRRLKVDPPVSRWQHFLETIVDLARRQIAEIAQDKPNRYLALIATLFLFIAVSAVLAVVPFDLLKPVFSWDEEKAFFLPPIQSLSSTAALATVVFFAVPIYGITQGGWVGYLKRYVQPSVIMLPFNIIGEVSRTLALAFRLFGNMMSGTLIVAVLLGILPFFAPVVMNAFGLLVGMIQAYIFAVLAVVYIASGARVAQQPREPDQVPAPSLEGE